MEQSPLSQPTLNPSTLRTADDLAAAGLLPPERHEVIADVARRYAIAISPAMTALIDACDPADPIARQFVPTAQELERHPAERDDPIGDIPMSPCKGLVHRYPDRVLLKVASTCPVYCRFCFRREMVGPSNGEALTAAELADAFAYIARTPTIWEVILTGGDPLILSPRRIGDITATLGVVPHVKVLRWHSRVPVVTPEKITDERIAALRSSCKSVFVAVHANHPRELTAEARAACARLVDAGIVLVSQSVLLSGVNNDVATLEALMRAFVEARVKPYYLHHGDLAPGTAHFRVPIPEGQALVAALRQRLSGLAMPLYVLDIPGGHGKVPIESAYMSSGMKGHVVTDRMGRRHAYEDCCAGAPG